MTSVNVTTTKNTVTVTEGDTRIVTIKTAGPQGPAFADGDIGDIVISGGGTVATIDDGVVNNAKIASNAAIALSKLATGALPTAITVTSANISDLSIVNADINASAAIDGSKLQASSASNSGTMSAADFTKLAAIETNATVDQTASEIKTLFNSNGLTNSQIGTGAAIAGTKISPDFGSQNITSTGNISANAVSGASFSGNGASITNIDAANIASGQIASARVPTLNQNTTGSAATFTTARTIAGVSFDGSANIDISYANLTNKLSVGDGGLTQNNFTNTLKTKLDGVAVGATNVTNTNQLTNGANFITASDGITGNAASATVLATARTIAGASFDGSANIDISYANLTNKLTVGDGGLTQNNFTNTLKTKLDGVETAATADQTAAEILTLLSDQNITTTGNINLNGTVPHINFTDSNNNPDYRIINRDGSFNIEDLDGSTVLFSTTASQATITQNLDCSAGVDITGDLTVSGNMTVSGTTTTIDTTTLTVEDKNIELGKVSTPTDTTADGGGITLKGATDKTFNWIDATDSWTSSEHIALPDGKKLKFGTGTDANINHSGSHFAINNDTGNIYLDTVGTHFIRVGTGNEAAIDAIANGAVKLYYDGGVAKFETTSTGAKVTGSLLELEDSATTVRSAIKSSGSNSYPTLRLENDARGYDLQINGATDAFRIYDITATSERLTIDTSGNVQIPNDNAKLQIGAGQDLEIFHDGASNSRIQNNTGALNIATVSNEIWFSKGTSEYMTRMITDGAVELYYDHSKRFETTAGGTIVTGTLDVTDTFSSGGNIKTGTDTGKFFAGASNDLQIYHDGTDSRIDNNTGRLFIETGTESRMVVNGNENAARFLANAAVELYYDHSKKLQTTANGAKIESGTANFEVYSSTDDADATITIIGKTPSGGVGQAGRVEIVGESTGTSNGASSMHLRTRKTNNTVTTAITIDKDQDVTLPIDGQKLRLGASQDLQLYHDGTDSFIKNTTGHLKIGDANVRIMNAACDEDMIHAKQNEQVELYYDGLKKLETTSSGVDVTGTLTATGQLTGHSSNAGKYVRMYGSAGTGQWDIYGHGANLRFSDNQSAGKVVIDTALDVGGDFTISSSLPIIYLTDTDHNSDYSIKNGNGDFNIKDETVGSNRLTIDSAGNTGIATSPARKFHVSSGSTNEVARFESTDTEVTVEFKDTTGTASLKCRDDFRFNNSSAELARLTSTGLQIANDTGKLQLGTSQDLELYHDGSNSYIKNTLANGDLILDSAQNFYIKHSGETQLQCVNDGAVNLYYDGSLKLETVTGGINVTGTVTDDGANHDGDVNFYGVSSYNAQWDKSDASLKLLDNAKIKIGSGGDLQLYHDGSNSFISEVGTGVLKISGGGGVYINNEDNSEFIAAFLQNGAVELFYDHSKKLETTSSGITLPDGLLLDNATNAGRDVQWQPANDRLAFLDNTKATFGNEVDLQIYHNGTDSIIEDSGTGKLVLKGSTKVEIRGSNGEDLAVFEENGAVELYYDNVKQVQTFSSGLNWQDNKKAEFGNSGDLKIYHDGSHSYLADTGTGNLNITASTVNINNAANSENIARFIQDGAVELYFDNSKKFRTYTDGVIGDENIWVGTDNKKLLIGGSADLQLYHDGTENFINSENGNIRIRNSAEDMMKLIPNGGVELYYDNSLKFLTQSFGAEFKDNVKFDNPDTAGRDVLWAADYDSMRWSDNTKATFGDGDDLQIYHNGTNNYIDSSNGHIYLRLNVSASSQENAIKCTQNGNVEISYDGTKKLETTSSGIDVDGTVTADDIITAGALLHEGDTNTLIHFSANDTIDFKTNGTERLRVVNAGVQLLSTLYTNGNNISIGDSASASDDRITFGDSQDLQIFHDGTNSGIQNTGGGLFLTTSTSGIFLRKDATGELARFNVGANNEFYFDNVKRFETTSTGATVTGGLLVGPTDAEVKAGGFYFSNNIGSAMSSEGIRRPTTHCIAFDTDSTERMRLSSGNLQIGNDTGKLQLGASQDLELYHDGTNSHIHDDTSATLVITNNDLRLKTSGDEMMIRCVANGSVLLNYDHSAKLETTSTGVTLPDGLLLDNATNAGRDVQWQPANDRLAFLDNTKATFGNEVDLQIYHNGTNNYIDSSNGHIYLRLNVSASSQENAIKCTQNGNVEISYDGTKKLETTSSGITVSGADTTGSRINGSLILATEGGTTNLQLFGSSGVLRFYDDKKASFGTGDDLQIYHNGTDSIIEDVGTGKLVLKGSTKVEIRGSNGEDLAVFEENGAVELYYDNVKQVQTTSNGVGFVNNCTFSDNKKIQMGDANDLQIFFDGTHSKIDHTPATGSLFLAGDSLVLANSGMSEYYLTATENGGVNLYYDNAKKLETKNYGVVVSGHVELDSGSGLFKGPDNAKLNLGNGNDLQLYHDGSHSYLADTGTGNLNITASTVNINNAANSENIARFIQDGAVELYFDNSKKFRTYTGGVIGDENIWVGSDNYKLLIGGSADLQLYHDGTENFINSENGNIRIRNSAEDMMKLIPNGAVELYYDNVKRFETSSDGVVIQSTDGSDCRVKGDFKFCQIDGTLVATFDASDSSLEFLDNAKLKLGTGDDLQIYSDGSTVFYRGNDQRFRNSAGDENFLTFIANGAATMFYDGSKKFETTSSGVTVTGTLTETSDIALKSNIKPLNNALEKIKQITGYKYNLNSQASMGVIAQDVEKVFPELVHGFEGKKSLQYSGLIGVLVEAVKDLSAKVAALEAG